MATVHINDQSSDIAGAADAEGAIRQLDGEARTEAVLRHAGQTLTVGGGPERFVIEMADAAAHRWRVVDPTQGQTAVRLRIGGAAVEVPAYRCLNLDAALEAARAFLDSAGERSAQLMWSMVG